MSALGVSSTVLNQTLFSWHKVSALSRSPKNITALSRLEVEFSLGKVLILQKYPRTGKRSSIVKRSVSKTSKNKVLNHTGYSWSENPKNHVLEYPKKQIDWERSPKNKVLNQTEFPKNEKPKDCTVQQYNGSQKLCNIIRKSRRESGMLPGRAAI